MGAMSVLQTTGGKRRWQMVAACDDKPPRLKIKLDARLGG
jgi:hypothetical protein